jgi:hypothetical protein
MPTLPPPPLVQKMLHHQNSKVWAKFDQEVDEKDGVRTWLSAKKCTSMLSRRSVTGARYVRHIDTHIKKEGEH